MLLALVVFSPYFVINRVTANWSAKDLSTWLDHAIPFQPAWELIYVSVYFYMFLPVVYLREQRIFRLAIAAFCLIQCVSFSVFLLMPVGMERPPLQDIDQHFLHWGLALNWLIDQPRNLFPSLHLANAFMVSLLMVRVDRSVGLPAMIWACLIGYSTLAAKHHLIGDVVAGIALACLADRLLFAPTILQPLPVDALYPRRHVTALVWLYLAILLSIYVAWWLGWRPFSWPSV